MGKILIIKGADFSKVAVSTVIPNADAPKITISNEGGVTMSCEGATAIYYTTNGTTPTTESTLYSSPFTVPSGTMIKAIGIVNGKNTPVSTKTYGRIPPYEDLNKTWSFSDKTWGTHGTSRVYDLTGVSKIVLDCNPEGYNIVSVLSSYNGTTEPIAASESFKATTGYEYVRLISTSGSAQYKKHFEMNLGQEDKYLFIQLSSTQNPTAVIPTISFS